MSESTTECPGCAHATLHASAHSRECRRALGRMRPECPDSGTCHHDCGSTCFRVDGCGPLSGVFPGDVWPEHIKQDPRPR